jgi:hypothetical protein
MSNQSIEHDLRNVARRFRWRTMLRNLTGVWLLGLGVGWALLLYSLAVGEPWPASELAVAVAASAALAVVMAFVHHVDLHDVARQVEQHYPELETRLLAAYEREQRLDPQGRGYLETKVIEQALLHARLYQRWTPTVPTRQLVGWSAVQAIALVLLAATFVLVPMHWPTSSSMAVASSSNSASGSAPLPEFEIEPGDVELERGSDLLVLARFADRKRLPRELALVTTLQSGEKSLAMQQSLSDPIFAGRVPEVHEDMTYALLLNGQRSTTYKVTVFDYPELERADAELEYPSYTELQPKRIDDVRQLSAIEGTKLRWLCRLNKPVPTASLVPAEGETLALTPSKDDPTLYTAELTLTTSQRWRLELTDDRGRQNREKVEFVVKVVPNRPPELKFTFPKRDLKVSPLQEVTLEATASDDFGLLRWGLDYELVGKKTESVTFGEKLDSAEKQTGKQLVALEDLHAQPDELLTWHLWAEDRGPDGAIRRTTSDIFFAEVSPFEEIFREESGEGTSEQSGKMPATDEAVNLQKEIISATWNLRRREKADALSASYVEDAETIAASQQKAIEQLAEIKQELKSPEAAKVIPEIESHMRAAFEALSSAASQKSLAPLEEALKEEQAAYQGLLRLRARESRVSRSKSSQAGGSQSASGQNLDQLELKNEEDLYEQQKSAQQKAQTPAEKEREEFLARLRELARRQEDMNEKIKELQAALDAAKNEEEKKAIERQLKRLRDEQREMLRDVDQLKNQFDEPKHSEPLAEASKQLDATRENVRQASDALEKGQVPQALTAGKRAESELDKLREDFRKQTAGQYKEEVRDLVDRARKLDERQQQIGTQLASDDKNAEKADEPPPEKKRMSLRGEEPKPSAKTPSDLKAELGQQRQELGEVLRQARELTERAEANEPLLTKQLYDTLREAHQGQTERAVEVMQQLVEHGLNGEAAKVAPKADEGVRQLREGIEKAAESVLGDDVEGLRRAKSEVDRLASALKDEIARENPQAAPRGKREDAKGGETTDPSKAATAQAGADTKGDPSKQAKSAAGEGDKPGEGKPDEKAQAAKSQPGGKGDKPGEGQPGKGGQGEEKGSQPSQTAGQEGESGSQGKGKGKQPSQQAGKGSQPGKGSQSGKGEPSQTASQEPSESEPGASAAGGREGKPSKSQGKNAQAGANTPGADASGSPESSRNSQATGANGGALNGPDWREWSDSLRNVEEFVPGTRLRSQAAQVREQAQAIRAESKRHSKPPNWDLVRETVYEPLIELQQQLSDELRRRDSREAVVPLDRDPVPDRYSEAVRRYYERLGSGQ